MKKILFLFVAVLLMLVSCNSPVQENDKEEVVSKKTEKVSEETKVEEVTEPEVQEVTEEPEQVETVEEQPVEETSKEQTTEKTVEEVTEETVEQPVEIIEEPVVETTEEPEVIEQPVVDPWVKINYTDGTFGIPYFVVPKGYDPMNFNRLLITEKFRNTNFLKFKKVNQTLVHKNKDNYKSSTFAFWKGDNLSRTFEAEVDVYEVYISTDYAEESAYITYNDLFTTEKNYSNPAYLLRKEDGVWNVYSAITANGEIRVPENDLAKRTNTVVTKYN